jgi:glycine dehydrogenase subunit 1
MGSYLPLTAPEREQMLQKIGVSSVDELFRDVPREALREGEWNLPAGKSELEVREELSDLADKNKVFKLCLRGAGSYRHYIPAVVKAVVTREEFVTAYTPYQAEISQGILQGIFEYQTMMCELTGMDVSNAGVYDGATAAAESITMCRDRKRVKAYVSETVNPQVLQVMRTYCFGSDVCLTVVPAKNGKTDPEALRKLLGQDAAMFYMQQPNYFGLFEDAAALGEITHAAGAKYVMGVNPIALALMKTPAECGADVAVGEGQPLGLDTAFGGPYLGFMTATNAMMRHLPGRIVGQTEDVDGKKGYVLTLSAREQHIRREKASSNICSNEQLCSLAAGVYLSAMGTAGLKQAATLSMSKAHYLAAQLEEKLGWKRLYAGEFFDEFVSECPKPEAALKKLEEHGILGGLPVEGGLLWCVTELASKKQLDAAVEILREVNG